MVNFAEMGRYRQQFIQATHRYNHAERTLDDLETRMKSGDVEDVQALLDQIEDARAACAAAKEEYENFSYLYHTGRPKPKPQETQTQWFTSFGVPAQPPKR